MTLYELRNDVARLGFESYIEDEEGFIASANRAIELIYADRPVSKTAVISFSGPRASTVREFIEHSSGKSVTIPVRGKAISFCSTGRGVCKIRDEKGVSTITLESDRQSVKRFIQGSGSVTFLGDFYYTVSNFAVFDDILSENSEDIPEYSPFKEALPKDYCDDFRAFCGQPCDEHGEPIASIKLIDGRLRVPYNYRKEVYLTYYAAPKQVGDSDHIEISEECAPLLPILTAAFMWLDDDAAKAQYYMSLYRDMIANLKRYSTNKIDTEYRVNGWA